jgi:hypothetical protein
MDSNSQINGPTSYHFSVGSFNSLPATRRDSYDATRLFELRCLTKPKAAEGPSRSGDAALQNLAEGRTFDETVKTVDGSSAVAATPLKRGVNETFEFARFSSQSVFISVHPWLEISSFEFVSNFVIRISNFPRPLSASRQRRNRRHPTANA